MGKSGTWNVGFGLDITDDHPLRVCGEKQTHDPQPWSRADGAEHFGIPIHVFAGYYYSGHISMILEISWTGKGRNKKFSL
ncbi:MAG TPA: hypothetical protein VFF64_24750 [Candidatus Eremiobacteraceae bacterium]|nr:hypothetical protein [Candidatus Eremiobacteraceae bacterium]